MAAERLPRDRLGRRTDEVEPRPPVKTDRAGPGPPPHLAALSLNDPTVMCLPCSASGWVQRRSVIE
eukprot:14329645-Heterocapsa_arctica.AAC.1